jgi:hypothetical protein
MNLPNTRKIFLSIAAIAMIAVMNVKSQTSAGEPVVFGYGFLTRIVGQWNGKVYSSTSAGSFDKWYVDYRPVSASQVSQFSLLDSNTVNITSFFVVKYNDKLAVAQRTEGCFKDKCCVTYEIMDSVNEAAGYYRFVDFVAGKKRACSIYKFTDNAYTMEVYTNRFNMTNTLILHTKFEPKLISRDAAKEAIGKFKFPSAEVVKDFTNAFAKLKESIFFNLNEDPYNRAAQPPMGTVTVNITIDGSLKTRKTDELCLLLTTEPLFEGLKYNPEKLNYLSKYVYLTVGTKSVTIKNVHPGKYYLYSYDDINFDKKHLRGDYMSSSLDNSFTVSAGQTISVDTKIDMVIP